MAPTVSPPWRVAMSRHSMRLGALARRSRACSSAAIRSPCFVAAPRSAQLWPALSPALAVEAEDVLVGAPVFDHLLALLRLLDRLDLVTQAGRLLEALGGRGGGHATPECGDHLVVPPFEEEHHLLQVLLVCAAVDGQHAGTEAALDVVLDARAAAVAEHGVAARA